MQKINFDHYAAAPVLPEAKQAIMAALEETGNASSVHQAGRRAKQLIEGARRQVAALINAKSEEIYFTSCGTESNNWALRGLMAGNRRKGLPAPAGAQRGRQAGNHLILSAIEHPSLSLAARRLEVDAGVCVSVLPVDSEAAVWVSSLKEAITPQTVLVSVMLANGEVGTIEPIPQLAAVAREQGALFHTDAIAAVGSIPVDVRRLGVDALSLSANSFGGPQGAAALYVREGARILPLMEGGGQERGARSGTENAAAIAGMGAAAQTARERLHEWAEKATGLREGLREGLAKRVEGIRFNGSWVSRLPNNLHVCIEGVSGESLALGLDQAGIAVGLGSACNSKSMRPSHVLKAMGLTDQESQGALVFSLGWEANSREIDQALEIIPGVVARLRRLTALTARS